MKELEELRNIYLSEDVDEESRKDNEELIRAWEKSLFDNQSFAEWQDSDVTRSISKKARETYRDIALQLATNRDMTQERRLSCWARQDAMLWLISIIARDAKSELEQIKKEITHALNVTS